MTFEEFLAYLASLGAPNPRIWAAIGHLPKPAQKERWKKVVHDMQPHLDGTMPDSIKEAFPNEDKRYLKYRERIFRSVTKGPIWSAISEVQRIVMGDKMRFEVFPELYDRLHQPYSMGPKFDVEKWTVDELYKARVRDPNALLAVVPTNVSEDASQPLGAALIIIGSKDIVSKSQMLVVADDVEASKQLKTQVMHVFTLNSYMRIMRSKSQVNGQGIELLSYYQHNNGSLGLEMLGGTLMTFSDKDGVSRKYYESDFQNAVPAMEDVEVVNNQLKVVTLNSAFPTRIIRGMDCDACKGKGKTQRVSETGELLWIDEHEGIKDMEECKSCAGRGTLPMGALDQIVVPEPPSMGIDGPANINLQTGYLQYVSPSTETIKEIREQKVFLAGTVDEVLNITKPSKFAESGIAKEKDREGRQTALKKIADGMAELIQNTLHNVANYVFPEMLMEAQNAKAKQETRIVAPQNFDIKTISELREEYETNLEQKPMGMRVQQYLSLVRKTAGEGSKELAVEKAAIEYTNGNYLRTPAELEGLVSLGALPNGNADVYIASIIISIIEEVYQQIGSIAFMEDKARRSKAITDAIAAKMAAFAPPVSPNAATNPNNQMPL